MTPAHPPNRLAHETSPYLLQHQFNPVNWYPWGEEAFAAARAQDKPIFLSVGYSACHWCHVMERESFENAAIAQLLNERFICIKVDREERPDIDQIYMTAVQLITRRGGWPMSVFLTPEGQPFYGGTYWPPTARLGMPGFREIILKLHDYWANRREEVQLSSRELAEAIQRVNLPQPGTAALDVNVLRQAHDSLLSASDRREGGFGGAPKFPHPMDLRLLLRLAVRFQSAPARAAVELSLDKMAAGGIYDHLGGGFHRYSTDAEWLVPHFEKMLYDNALLVPVYLEAWQLTRKPRYLEVVQETLDYVLREMTQPGGGFYSTQDADSEGEEGKFFVWHEREIRELLPPAEADLFCQCYDVTPGGNWEHKTILRRLRSNAEDAARSEISEAELAQRLASSRATLFAARSQRVAPGRDDKVLVAWNGMMIAACARAGAVLQEPRYLQAADAAAEFIATRIQDATGQLLHSYKDGQARFTAYLDDYACYLEGLLELYLATGAARWIELAVKVAEQMLERFADPDDGGFFYTAHDHEQLIARIKDAQDNATPSGNGMAATVLLKLARLTGRPDFQQAGEQTLQLVSEMLAESPLAVGQSLLALDFLLGPIIECVLISGAETDPVATPEGLLTVIHQQYLPRLLCLLEDRAGAPAPTAELFAGRTPQPVPTAFVCLGEVCHPPVTTPSDLLSLLQLVAAR